jgi:hypothetical protein
MNRVDSWTAMTKQPRYLSFILRIWLAGDGDNPEWRASLEDTTTGQRRGFGSLEELFDMLKAQIEPTAEIRTKKGE